MGYKSITMQATEETSEWLLVEIRSKVWTIHSFKKANWLPEVKNMYIEQPCILRCQPCRLWCNDISFGDNCKTNMFSRAGGKWLADVLTEFSSHQGKGKWFSELKLETITFLSIYAATQAVFSTGWKVGLRNQLDHTRWHLLKKSICNWI